MRYILCINIVVLLNTLLFSQSYQKAYRSAENPYYCANRKPHAAYWQQDVNYHIKVRIDEHSDILAGSLRLIYYNNSPDTLNHVYFHLYQNAFVKGSHFHKKQTDNNNSMRFGRYQKLGLGTVVEEMIVDGNAHDWILDNTILRVDLAKPIKSMDSAVFDIRFRTYFNIDAGWGRMRLYERWGYKHFNGAHFYPRISVYDSKFGWTADQHLVHEFYGNFGTYTVELDMPNNYILEATGTLINESEVLSKELRERIDLSNFKDKPYGEAPSVIIAYDSTVRKVWKYYAINVHDFAFVASPTYRMGEVLLDGVKCVAIAHESHASGWQTAAQVTADIIDIFNKKVGTYAYPKMVVADAFSGMEYPMLTMNYGRSPDYAYIFSHEIGHNWFYGMVGSNETYNAFIDEGFTQYLTIYALEKLREKYPIESDRQCAYHQAYKKSSPLRDRYAYLRYLNHAITTEGATLNTHSDMYDTRRPYGETYRQTYYKSAVMLFNLKYVLGEELFNKALQHFFEQWKFCHPYSEDVRNSFIQSTKVDLNWFFDQFIETTKVIDYSVASAKRVKKPHTYQLVFKRKGQMQMPIDFTVVSKNDSLLHFHIPNTDFVKKTDAVVLSKWYGWMHFNRTYTAELEVPGGLKNVVIDPSGIMADVYAPDNSLKKQVSHQIDFLLNQTEDRYNYEIYYRPDLWWNRLDGIKTGINVNSHYMHHFHVIDLNIWYNSGLLKQDISFKPNLFSYAFSYSNPIGRYNKQSRLHIDGVYTDGFHKYAIGATYNIRKKRDYLYAEIRSLFRCDDKQRLYSVYPEEWEDRIDMRYPNFNNTLNVGYKHFFSNSQRSGYLELKSATSFLLSPYDFSKISLTLVNDEKIDLLRLKNRFFVQWATGTFMPAESMLYLAGANPEELLDNKFTRSSGIVPEKWGGYGPFVNHFHAGGGLNVRGYAGYLAPQFDKNGLVVASYKGHSGVSLNTELEFDAIFNIKPKYVRDYLKINSYLFADAGIININSLDTPLELGSLRISSGIGFAFIIKKWYCFDKLKPLTLRLDFPLFLNRPPAMDDDFMGYRWLLGVNRAL